MTTAEVRNVPLADVTPWLRCFRAAILEDPSFRPETLPYWAEVWDADRVFGAVDNGRFVGTLRTFGTTLSVPSGPGDCTLLPTDALTQVGVSATHRRQGLLRQMLSRSLANAKERGEVVSLLRAAEWPIYGRFGYWPATKGANYTIRSHSRPQLLGPAPTGVVSGIEVDQLVELAPDVLRRVQARRAGHIDRSPMMWQRFFGLQQLRPPGDREPVCVVVRNEAGEVDGYAKWTAGDDDWFHEPLQSTVAVRELLAVTPDAYRALWSYLLGLDLVGTLTLDAYPVDEPLEWLLSDGRAARRTWTGDNDWLRILDLPAALNARRYQHTDRLVLQVVDAEGGFAAGRFTLDGGPDHASCEPSPAATADLTVQQRGLAGIYLGGNTVRSQQLAGLIDEHTPGAAARLEAMFWTAQQPWNATPF